MEQIIKNIIIKGSSDREIGMDLWINSNNKNQKPIVVFCHGYKGFKDWGCWNLVAKKFAKNGFNFLKFNFSHNGVTPDHLFEFSDLEAFGNNNYTKELFDLEKVIDWISEPNDYSELVDLNKIYVVGHSRGGGIGALATARDNRIRKTVTWASVSNLIDRIPRNVQEWKEQGVVYQVNGRTKQNMPLFYQLYENTMANKDSLDISRVAKKIRTPFCVIHGSEDSVVKVEEAILLDSFISNSNLVIIEGASHTFGSSHPAVGNELPKDLTQVVEESLIFFKD